MTDLHEVRKTIIGLIGGLGSGKSRVAAELEKHGARVINADALGHEALRQPAIREQLAKRWGKEVLDDRSEISRGKVARIVFADAVERQFLERLVHPYIGRRLREEIDAAQAPLVVLDAAIMLETGWNDVCDRLVYVHAPRDVRLRRLAEQRGWSEKEVAAREQAQLTLSDKAGRADGAVDNSGTPEHLARRVADLLRCWSIV
jgi:dephospho-CoA kinase